MINYDENTSSLVVRNPKSDFVAPSQDRGLASPTLVENNEKSFMINNVFMDDPLNPETKEKNQESFYAPIITALCDRAISNLSSSLVVVGPPKSGKSYTLHCSPPTHPSSPDNFSSPTQADDNGVKTAHSGILPRLICSMLSKAKNGSSLRHACVTISACQIYNEQITDLLAPKQPGPRLILVHSKTVGAYVDGLTDHVCKNAKFAVELYEQAMAVHAWLLGVERRRITSGATVLINLGIVHEVGGERTNAGVVKVVEVGGFEGAPDGLDVGDRLNKLSQVGKGLESLKKILTHLGQSEGVPNYRLSTLTYLLRDALGGKDEKR